MKILILFVVSFLCLTPFLNVLAGKNQVITSISNGKNYYHLKYSLLSRNIISLDSYTEKQLSDNGGQFEILIRKDAFPIPAPHCKSDIVLRMPWTNSRKLNTSQFISEKVSIYREIRNIVDSKDHESIDIVIELNPYVLLKLDKFELTQCNVFFRHARGRYISNTGNLK